MKYAYILLLLLVCQLATAQDTLRYRSPYTHNLVVSFGAGFLDKYRHGEDHLPARYTSSTASGAPQVYISADYNISKRVSLGVVFAYDQFTYDNTYLAARNYRGFGSDLYFTNQDQFSVFQFGGYARYQFFSLFGTRKLKPYITAGLAHDHVSHLAKPTDNGPQNTDEMIYNPIIRAGIRYYPIREFAAFVEAGYDNLSFLSAGISFRFNCGKR